LRTIIAYAIADFIGCVRFLFYPLLVVKEESTVRIGIAADHGGFELKKQLSIMLRESEYEVVDFGTNRSNENDDYPDFVLPLAKAVSNGTVERGIAICGSGVGACIAANKVPGIRACLIHDVYSAHQGVEDDNMNMICLGGRTIGYELAWDLTKTFLTANFDNAERHVRRLSKISNEERAPKEQEY
jgi:ribose 5-phosphate isomerase B